MDLQVCNSDSNSYLQALDDSGPRDRGITLPDYNILHGPDHVNGTPVQKRKPTGLGRTRIQTEYRDIFQIKYKYTEGEI